MILESRFDTDAGRREHGDALFAALTETIARRVRSEEKRLDRICRALRIPRDLNVGRIVQQATTQAVRGQEKGYFEYGGSSVALFGEAGAWRPDEDLLERTATRVETLIRLGTPIATTR